MEWSTIWSFIVKYGGKFLTLLGGVAGLATLIIAAAQFMGKRWIEGWFERRTQEYQNELDKQLKTHEVELDRKSREIQTSFDVQMERMRIEYGKLYDERIQIIKAIYSHLNQIYTNISLIYNPHSELDAVTKIVFPLIIKDFNSLTDIINANNIYFSKEMSLMLEQSVSNAYIVLKSISISDSASLDKSKEKLFNANNSLLKPTIEIMADEFRNLIGLQKYV